MFRPNGFIMLADVVLTFTKWTDDFRVDLTKPSILDNIKLSLKSYNNTVSIENYPQFQEMENAFVIMFPTLTFAGLIFPAYVTFKRESGHRYKNFLFFNQNRQIKHETLHIYCVLRLLVIHWRFLNTHYKYPRK